MVKRGIVFAAAFFAAGVAAAGDFGIGVNYPGFGIRYRGNNGYAIEAKGQFSDGVTVAGGRFYKYLNHSPCAAFIGGESDFVSFKGDYAEGKGWAGELFFGVEYFFGAKYSFQADFGPAWIILHDRFMESAVDGAEYVVNFGINYYFGGKTQKLTAEDAKAAK